MPVMFQVAGVIQQMRLKEIQRDRHPLLTRRVASLLVEGATIPEVLAAGDWIPDLSGD